MDPSEPRPSPRRELQGPRPTPLKVNKDSYKIRKPPVAPARLHHHQEAAAAAPQPPMEQHRGPVIIYTVSPKIIHTKPSDFMTLVQRLTGPNASDDPAAAAADISLQSPSAGLHSPAAKIAAFEKSSPPSPSAGAREQAQLQVVDQFEMDVGPGLNRPASSFPGILSPMPTSLPQISPNFFSPSLPLDPSILRFLQELSPAVGSSGSNNNNNGSSSSVGFFDGGNFLVSPSNNFWSTPTVPSPGAFWEFLSQLPDL